MKLAALALGMVFIATAPAHAAWKEYTYADLGVAKSFPAEPAMSKGSYKSPLAVEAPSVTYAVVDDGISYQMTVVDFQKRAGEGGNLVLEAASLMTAGKGTKFEFGDFPLYDKGTNSVYGVLLTVDKKEGEHSMGVVFFNKGRLYLVKAIVPPGGDRMSSGVSRFMDTIVFHLAGYGFDYKIGHDYPLGDDRPENRDTHPIAGYKPPAGYENASGPLKN